MNYLFEENILNTIKKYNMINVGDKVVVAVSGGPDSMALLNTLLNLKNEREFEIVVAHVNHMIRAVANDETEYVEQFCKKHNIACHIKYVDVIKKADAEKISTEEAGRNARYDFFEEVLKNEGANKIAIAHNANDNAETVLMNIIRGTGVSGLKGIEPVRNNKYIRPLIETGRRDIELYCEEKKLHPKFDESNKENLYTRNKVRNLLIPYIEQNFNPSFIEAVNRLSDLANQENMYIDKTVINSYNNMCICEKNVENDNDFLEEVAIDLKKFNCVDEFLKSKIVLLCATKIFGSTKGVEKKHIDDIISMCSKNIGNKYLTPNKHFKVFVNRGVIQFSRITTHNL